MPVELAGIKLERIHRITTLEDSSFVNHKVPGLDGALVQDMGRDSVRLKIQGIFYGETAKDDMESLRDMYKARKPVDFLADVVGQAYFGQVILESFEVFQQAEEPEQFSYMLTIAEYVEPPQPVSTGLLSVDAGILAEAMNFMDIVELPGILSLPEFSDPTQPLGSMLDGVKSSVARLEEMTAGLHELFGEE